MCNVAPNSEQANILRRVKVFIIDEASMIPCYALDAIDRCLCDIMSTDTLFGGQILLLAGDFRQILPVVSRSPTPVLESCIKRSNLWHRFHQMRLTQNMRPHQNEEEFFPWLLQLGYDELSSTLNDVPVDSVDIPVNFAVIIHWLKICSTDAQMWEWNIELAYGLQTDCLALNEEVLNMLPSELKTYFSIDSFTCNNKEEAQNYPMDFIKFLTPSGMPPQHPNLKVGAIVMLLQNFSINQRLYNGIHMKIHRLHENFVEASLLTGSHRGSIVLISRRKSNPTDINMLFTFNRTHFPLRPSYSMAINKAQGQTFDKVGIHLQQPVFTHGQLYVVFPRARALQNVRIKVMSLNKEGRQSQRHRIIFTRNVVYKEAL